jgi:hypothetical protein
MKQKLNLKSLLVAASIFSLFAFLFVNLHANCGTKQNCLSNPEFVQTQIAEEEENTGKIAVPDFTMLGRLWDVAHKLIERKH